MVIIMNGRHGRLRNNAYIRWHNQLCDVLRLRFQLRSTISARSKAFSNFRQRQRSTDRSDRNIQSSCFPRLSIFGTKKCVSECVESGGQREV